MCLYPRLTKNRKFTENKKNGGVVPSVLDFRTLYVSYGCGNCIECRKQKARDWCVRLHEELRVGNKGVFITLTFSDESIQEIIGMPRTKVWAGCDGLHGYELDNTIAKRGVRLFLENWRKKFGQSVRHWLVTELGHNGTQNVHLHGILWNVDIEDVRKVWRFGYIYPRSKEECKINYVNERTVNYIVKYIHKVDLKNKYYKSIILCSSGIGGGYVSRVDAKNNKFKGVKTDESYRLRNGHKVALPMYYRNKIYTDDEREDLWIMKLDENKRYVCGEYIDISSGLNDYWKALDWYRKINRSLGYGMSWKNWERFDYENARRDMMYDIRLGKK